MTRGPYNHYHHYSNRRKCLEAHRACENRRPRPSPNYNSLGGVGPGASIKGGPGRVAGGAPGFQAVATARTRATESGGSQAREQRGGRKVSTTERGAPGGPGHPES